MTSIPESFAANPAKGGAEALKPSAASNLLYAPAVSRFNPKSKIQNPK
jgi:hypothetical protein